MPMELQSIMSWTFTQKTEPTPEIMDVLLKDEEVLAAYKTIRDVAVITDKRLIIADRQGLMGKKVEVYSIPFKSVTMWSSENAAGAFDFNSELTLWTKAGTFKLKLSPDVDIRELDLVIANGAL